MKTHLQGTLTVGVFMKLTAKDGDVIRVWNGTRNKMVDGELYLAYPLAPSQLQVSNGLSADNFEISAVYAGLFNAATLRSGKWKGARVEYRIMNYKDLSMGYAERRVAFLGKVVVGRFGAKAEVNTLSSKLGEPWGRTCNAECDVERLGDPRCGVDLNGETEQGLKITVPAHISATVLNRQQFTVVLDENLDTGVTIAPDGFYNRGVIRFLSGANEGLETSILTNDGNALTLYLPTYYMPVAGDELELETGCARDIVTCARKFANAKRHKGFPSTPGRSKVLKIPE